MKAAPGTPGLWPLLRCDERLRGHQALSGRIAEPSIAWRYRLGGPLFDGRLVARESGDGAKDLLLNFGGCIHRFDSSGRMVWKSKALGIEAITTVDDIDNDGVVEIVASNGKTLFVLDSRNGDELWSTYLGPPSAGGFMHTAVRLRSIASGAKLLAVGMLSSKEVVVFDFTTGARTPKRTHVLWMDDFFHPSLLFADMNTDARDELVITKLSAVYVFDPETGEKTSECRWSSGGTLKRNYGLLQAVDISGSGASDLVVISDRVSRHIAVVANDGTGQLTNAWDRFLEHIYDTDERELHFVTSSVLDVDLDGDIEIVVSIFNEHGDSRWWLEVINAADGTIRVRVPDIYLRGIVSNDRSLRPTILASHETTRVPSERARIVAMDCDGENCREIWASELSAFVGRFADDSPKRALFRTDLPPSDDVRCTMRDGNCRAAFLNDDGLSFVDISSSPVVIPVPNTSAVVSILDIGDVDVDDVDEIVVSDIHGTVSIIRWDGSCMATIEGGIRLRPGTGAYYMAKPMSTAVVSADANGRYCAVPDGGADVHILKWDSELLAPARAALVALRGRIGPEEAYHSVSWMEHDGDAVVVGSNVGEREAAMIAVDARGRQRWHATVPLLPSSPPTPSARTGVHDFALVGSDGNASLIVAGFRSSSMNSEVLISLAIDEGTLNWQAQSIRVPGHVLASAPWSAMSIERSDHDTRIHFLAKDTLCAFDVTGATIDRPLQLRPFNTADMARRALTVDDFSAYGSVIPMDDASGAPGARLLIANYGGHGLIARDGAAVWWHSAPLSSLTGGFGGLADIDDDGRLELGVIDATGTLSCIDAITGSERWMLDLGMVATGIVSCDIDGCGRAEFVISTREGSLLAIGVDDADNPIVKWRIDLGYSLGPAVIADFNGDGKSEVLVVSGDGFLYSIDDHERGRTVS